MLEYMVVPIEWKADESGDGNTLVGYASTFGNVDLGGDVVMKGAFLKTIENIKANGIPLLADHIASTASVLGTIYDGAEDGRGLKIKARISSAPSAQDTAVKLREGHLSKMSIGYETMDESYEDRDGVKVRLLKEVKLWETSVVVFPMNPQATINGMKNLARAAVEAGITPEQVAEAVAAEAKVSDTPWSNFSESDYTPEQWRRACLIHLAAADGQDPLAKSLHKLPVREPGGAVNRNGVHAAAGALAGSRGGVDAPAEAKTAAAKTLLGLYRNQLNEDPPDSLYRAAGQEPPAKSVETHGMSTLDFWRIVMASEAKAAGVPLPEAEQDSSTQGESSKEMPQGEAAPTGPDNGTAPETADDAASAPDEGASGYDRFASRAILAGRPLTEVDPVTRASLETRLLLAERQLPPPEKE